jgi:hypothetical protein
MVSEVVESIVKEPLFVGSLHDTGIEVRTDTLRKERNNMNMHP